MRSAYGCKSELMLTHNCINAIGLADLMQKPQLAVGTRRIEARDRLVGENERWLLHERSRNTDALLLAAGQLIGAAQRTVDQADAFDGIQTEPLLVCRETAAGCESSSGNRDVPSGRWRARSHDRSTDAAGTPYRCVAGGFGYYGCRRVSRFHR
jgi:hypothetical protein